MPVRTGRPELRPGRNYQNEPSLPFSEGLSDEFSGPQYSAAVGLAMYGAAGCVDRPAPGKEDLFSRMTGFLSGIMGKNK
jgi:hypothetical protein